MSGVALLAAIEVQVCFSGPLFGLVVELCGVEELPQTCRPWLPS